MVCSKAGIDDILGYVLIVCPNISSMFFFFNLSEEVFKSVRNISCKDVTQKDTRVLFWCGIYDIVTTNLSLLISLILISAFSMIHMCLKFKALIHRT